MSTWRENVLEVPQLRSDRWQSLPNLVPARLFDPARAEVSPWTGLSSHFGTQTALGRQTLADSALETILAEARLVSFRFEKRIQDLWVLPTDWDGEGAVAIGQDVLAKAVHIVRQLQTKTGARFVEPFVSPTYDGFVQLDWTSDLRLLEAQLVAGGVQFVGTEISLRGERDYFSGDARDVPEAIWQAYRWFCGSEPVWPTSL